MMETGHKVKVAKQYLLHKLNAKSSKGHGIHSPFVYRFAREVIHENETNDNVKAIEAFRDDLQKSKLLVGASTHGARASRGTKILTLGELARTSSVNSKHGAFLYRLAKWLDAKSVLELGTSIGISTLYLSKACPWAKIITLEGDKQRISHAKKTFETMECNNIELMEGDFEHSLLKLAGEGLTFDLIFFDGNHKSEPTLRYFKLCNKMRHENSVFVFDDIRWSREMFKTWQIVSEHKSVSLSLDLFNFGILLFKPGMSKQHFTINL